MSGAGCYALCGGEVMQDVAGATVQKDETAAALLIHCFNGTVAGAATAVHLLALEHTISMTNKVLCLVICGHAQRMCTLPHLPESTAAVPVHGCPPAFP